MPFNLNLLILFLTHMASTQTTPLSETEIERYVQWVDQLKVEHQLDRISYPNMSGCGGAVDGYYFNQKLVLIESIYNAELGFSSRKYYLEQDSFVKIIYHEHFADWDRYQADYPPDKFDFDASKMTYTDTLYSIFLAHPAVFYKTAGNHLISKNPEQPLLDRLLSCGQEMKNELHEVTDQADSLK
ncbi:MAG: hypothetical protein GC180_03300 [Bacteroidetes bacterium]|nr:hypothetical protein [Bacteroidota bacterium]